MPVRCAVHHVPSSVSQRRALAPPLHLCRNVAPLRPRYTLVSPSLVGAIGQWSDARWPTTQRAEGGHMWHGRAPIHMCLAIPISFEGCPVCEGPRAPDNHSGPSHHIHFHNPSQWKEGRRMNFTRTLSFCAQLLQVSRVNERYGFTSCSESRADITSDIHGASMCAVQPVAQCGSKFQSIIQGLRLR